MRKRRKHFILLTGILITVIALVSACGNNNNNATQPPTGNEGTTNNQGTTQTPTATGDANKGETLFKGNCMACHGAAGTGGHNGPDLQLSTVADDHEATVAKIKAGGGGMPGFEGVLTEEQINDLAAYINQVLAPMK